MICLPSLSGALEHVLKQIMAERRKTREQEKVTKDTRSVSFLQPDTPTGHQQSSPWEDDIPAAPVRSTDSKHEHTALGLPGVQIHCRYCSGGRHRSQQVLSCSITQFHFMWGKVRRRCFSWGPPFQSSMRVKSWGQPAWVWSWLGHFLAAWPQVSFFTSLCLSVLIRKMGIATVPTSSGVVRIKCLEQCLKRGTS